MQKLFELLNDERFAIDNFEFPDIKSENVDFSLPENILANYNKLRENLVSYEAIDFQRYSKLGAALTKVFQKAIDYRDSLIPEMNKLPSSEKDNFLRKKLINYSIKTMSNELISAIKNSVNITVKKVHCALEPECSYAVLPILGDDTISDAVWVKSYGQRYIGVATLEEVDVTFKELSTISDQLDLKTGRMKSDKWGTKNKLNMYCELFFDPLMSFGMRTYLPMDQFEEFTARELAAVYLHEIGHMTSHIERAADAYYFEKRAVFNFGKLESANAKDLCMGFLKNKDNIKTYLDKLSSMYKNNKALEKVKECTFTIFDVLASIFESLENNPDNEVTAYIWAFFRACVILYCKFIYITFGVIGILYRFALYGLLYYANNLVTNNMFTGYKIDDFKASDVVYTEYDFTSSERDADEYAVRSGFGKEQVEGLRKMVGIIKKFYYNAPGNRLPEIIRQNKYLWMITEYISFINVVFSVFMIFPVEVHGRDIWRFKNMARQTIELFKGIPNKEMRDTYLAQYEGILEQIEKAKTDKYVKIDEINVLVSNFFRGNFLSNIFGSGNLPNDYNKVREELEDLMNNKLYYASAKLSQLAD